MEDFQSCAQGLQHLKETYASTASVLASVDAAIKKRASPPEARDTRLLYPLNDDRPRHKTTVEITDEENNYSETFSPPTIAQQLDNLKIPEMSDLLCSHFMMTPSERSLLQNLALTEDNSSGFLSENDSLSEEDAYTSSAQGSIINQSQLSIANTPETNNMMAIPEIYPLIDIFGYWNNEDDSNF